MVLRKLADAAARADKRARTIERDRLQEIGLREAAFRLTATPPTPPDWDIDVSHDSKHSEAIVLPVSDVHFGEVVELAQMDGRNQYNVEIATARLHRLFSNYVKLGTEHWSGPEPDVIYLPLLGDLTSGDIHEELSKTNDLLALPSVRRVSECLIAGIQLLLKHFSCPIRVVSLPGNHGRLTRIPEAKDFALNSYDTMAAWYIESWFAAIGEKRVHFSAPASGDALIRIHGWNILFTHGDRIGSSGGQGFVGPSATIARGMQKLIMEYAANGVVVDQVVMGHFHTSLQLEQGFANGSVVGPSEYSRTIRARPMPASQWMLAVHPVHGITRRWQVQIGVPSEGSIYKGRA